MMKKSKFPKGWEENRVNRVLDHYENQTEDEAVADRKKQVPIFDFPFYRYMVWCWGMGQSTPHGLILEAMGALLRRFYFYKRYSSMWRQYAPILLAGFSCGMGLTGMFAMGITLILKSLGRLSY